MTYAQYLQSDEWRMLRAATLVRDNGRCVMCGDPASNVHHSNYGNRNHFTHKNLFSLWSLCRKCHHFIEFDYAGRKTSMIDMRRRMVARAVHFDSQNVLDRMAALGWSIIPQRPDGSMRSRKRNSIGDGKPPTGGENGYADKPRCGNPVTHT